MTIHKIKISDEFKIKTLGECTIPSPLPSSYFVYDDSGVLVDPTTEQCKKCNDNIYVMELAGPRAKLFFNPSTTRIGIVTCGGLCPGLNDVIRAITMVAWYRYGIRDILGFRYGYAGLVRENKLEPIILNPDIVADIHQKGGTILGSSRGYQNINKMIECLLYYKINILFTIGGDGTQKGALALCREIEKRNLSISIVGLPKTIDNDIMYTDRTFGFETAVTMSQAPIDAAHMEAKGVRNGIGLVKLMGRESGFVAAYASLASSNVNLVLVPEVPFSINGVLHFLEERLKRKGHAVIVVAEGAGQQFFHNMGTDESGNRILGDIGKLLKDTIIDYFRSKSQEVHVRYIDPSYTIRSAPATADDSVLCFNLGQYAVHAAMAGKTEMLVAVWNNHFVHVPITKAIEKRKYIDPTGLLWQSILDNTGQPSNLI